MDEPIFWLIWYCCAGLYTVAMITAWGRKIEYVRAAVLWPVFWLVVVYQHWRKW